MNFEVLGPLRVTDGSRSIGLGARNLRVTLAMLLSRPNEPFSTDQLIDAIWDGWPPKTAAKNLQVYIYKLRLGLGQARIISHPHGYAVLVRPGELDAETFNAAVGEARQAVGRGDLHGGRAMYAQALSLWRGPAFADLATAKALQEPIARLADQRLAAIEARIDADLTLGAHEFVTAELNALVLAHPLREHLRRQQMVALFRCGRQAEALQSYAEGRQLLADELGIEPAGSLTEAHLAILRGVDPEPAATTIHRPPADVPDFTGRNDELDRLARLLTRAREHPVAVCLTGMGGTGKTTLAVRVANLVHEQYPGGCVFLDLRGTEPAPAEPHELMGSVLRSLGLPGSAIPDDPNARAGLYRAQLAGRGLLLVLDNAAHEGQVRPLVPPSPTAAVLVTSRQSLAGIDAIHIVELTALPTSSAVELLANLAGKDLVTGEPEAARRLVDLCGGLPLAVRIVGVKLTQGRRRSVDSMVRRLETEQSRLDELAVGDRSVRAVLGMSLRR
ncbi:MAG TPA: BTAD domain-containing putative transcriptional regulator, partial [Micromonosporaceae bacterium]